MRVYDLIAKKRDGGTHSREEVEQSVNGYVSGAVSADQMAAWMLGVYSGQQGGQALHWRRG